MSFIKRAVLYVTRKRGKSLLLFAILLIMATFVLTGLSIWRATEFTQQNLRQSLGGEFIIGTDYSEQNPYLHTDTIDTGFLVYSEKQLSPEMVESVRALPGVKSCNATAESLADFEQLSLFTGTIPITDEFRGMTTVVGVWRSEENSLFTSGTLTLEEGRHLTGSDTGKAVISKDLAEKSGVTIGDTLTATGAAGTQIEVQIVGLFAPQELESPTDMVTTYDKIQNRIFLDLASLITYEKSPAIQGFNEMTVTVDDPQNMEQIISEVKALPTFDWTAFSVMVDDQAYQSAAQSLDSLKELVMALLLVIIVVSAVILSLILTMWARSRIYETGVFLAVGIRKASIVGQYLVEVLLVAVLAFGLSYFTSGAVAEQIGSSLYRQSGPSITAEEVQGGADAAGAVRGSSGTLAGEQETDAVEFHISVDAQSLLLLYLTGLAVVVLAVGASSIPVMRLKPREILSKMS